MLKIRDHILQELRAVHLKLIRQEERAGLCLITEDRLAHFRIVDNLHVALLLEPGVRHRWNTLLQIPDSDAVPDLLQELKAVSRSASSSLHVYLSVGEEAAKKLLFFISTGVLRKLPRKDVAPFLRLGVVDVGAVGLDVVVAVARSYHEIRRSLGHDLQRFLLPNVFRMNSKRIAVLIQERV